MRIPAVLVMSSFLISHGVIAADVPMTYDACTQILLGVEKSGEAITKQQVNDLLASVNPACLSNVETSEWTNELLFSTLLNRPDAFIQSFAKLQSKAQDSVLNELQNPINDGIDLGEVYRRVLKSSSDGAEKQRILSAIKAAAAKGGVKLQ